MEQLKNNIVVVDKNSGTLKQLEASLKCKSITFANKTNLTAKADSMESINKEQSLIEQYKKILQREINNIKEIGDGFQKMDEKYAKGR